MSMSSNRQSSIMDLSTYPLALPSGGGGRARGARGGGVGGPVPPSGQRSLSSSRSRSRSRTSLRRQASLKALTASGSGAALSNSVLDEMHVESLVRISSLESAIRKFEEADEDGSGELDLQEFLDAFGTLLGGDFGSRDQVEELFHKIDANQDGSVDVGEFIDHFISDLSSMDAPAGGGGGAGALATTTTVDKSYFARVRSTAPTGHALVPGTYMFYAALAKSFITLTESGDLCAFRSSDLDATAVRRGTDGPGRVTCATLLADLNVLAVGSHDHRIHFTRLAGTNRVSGFEELGAVEVGTLKSFVVRVQTSESKMMYRDAVPRLEHVPLALDYGAYGGSGADSVLVVGDDGGHVTAYLFGRNDAVEVGVAGLLNGRNIGGSEARAVSVRHTLPLGKNGTSPPWMKDLVLLPGGHEYVAAFDDSTTSLVVGPVEGEFVSSWRVGSVPGGVNAVTAWASNGVIPFVASGGRDGAVRVWKPSILSDPLMVFSSGQTGTAAAIVHLTPGLHDYQIVSLDASGVVRIWDIRKTSCVSAFSAGTEPSMLSRMLYADKSRGRIITAGAGSDGIATWRRMRSQDGTRNVTHDTEVVAFAHEAYFGNIVTASVDGTISVWSVSSGVKIKEFGDIHGDSPVTAMILCNKTRIATAARNGEVKVWNFMNGKFLKSLYKNDATEVSGLAFAHQLSNHNAFVLEQARAAKARKESESMSSLQGLASSQKAASTADVRLDSMGGGGSGAKATAIHALQRKKTQSRSVRNLRLLRRNTGRAPRGPKAAGPGPAVVPGLESLRPSEDNKFIIAVGWNRKVCIWRDTKLESNPNDQFLWKEMPEASSSSSSSSSSGLSGDGDGVRRLPRLGRSGEQVLSRAGTGGGPGVSTSMRVGSRWAKARERRSASRRRRGRVKEEVDEVPEVLGDEQARGHEEDILCCTFCPPNLIATGGYDGVLLVWNLNSQRVLYRFESAKETGRSGGSNTQDVLDHVAALDEACVASITFIPPPNDVVDSLPAIVAGGGDGRLRVWQLWDPKRAPVVVDTTMGIDDTIIKTIEFCELRKVLMVGDSRGRVKMYKVSGQALAGGVASLSGAATGGSGDATRITSRWEVKVVLCADVAVAGLGATIVGIKPLVSERKGYRDLLATAASDKRVRLWRIAYSADWRPVALRYIGTFGQGKAWSLGELQSSPPHDVLKAEQAYVQMSKGGRVQSRSSSSLSSGVRTMRAVTQARSLASKLAAKTRARTGYKVARVSVPSVEHLLVASRAKRVNERTVWRAIPIEGDALGSFYKWLQVKEDGSGLVDQDALAKEKAQAFDLVGVGGIKTNIVSELSGLMSEVVGEEEARVRIGRLDGGGGDKSARGPHGPHAVYVPHVVDR